MQAIYKLRCFLAHIHKSMGFREILSFVELSFEAKEEENEDDNFVKYNNQI